MSENVVSEEQPRDVSHWDWIFPLLSSPVSRCHLSPLAPEREISAPLKAGGVLALVLVEQGFLWSVSG